VRVAVTGASNDGVHRWSAAEEALAGNFSAAALEGMSVPADDMIADLHGSAAYRAHLVAVLTRRAVTAAG
jgi:carbon-monoxide dehydrogenase medium subunit